MRVNDGTKTISFYLINWYKHLSCGPVVVCALRPRLHSGVVDDDEGGTRRLLTSLTNGGLLRRLGEHSRRVEVVDPCLEETGSQGHAQHLLRLQLQLVLGPTHPGERAVDLHRLWAGRGTTHVHSHASFIRSAFPVATHTYLGLLCLRSMRTSTGAEEQLDSVSVTGTTHRLETQAALLIRGSVHASKRVLLYWSHLSWTNGWLWVSG